jgi:ATP/maltotriose-dependent transcriptional regulator MalT
VDKKLKSPISRTKVKLTGRELEVLRLMATDMSNREIASTLLIAEGTVKIHVHHILSKLDVNSRTGAITEGLKRRLLRI